MTDGELPAPDILRAREHAELLADHVAVDAAFDRLAAALTQELSGKNPIVLAVMTGGIVTAGILLPRLAFPLEVDYVHATRYGDSTTGGDLTWLRRPAEAVKNRHVLIVDDLLDHGVTLAAIVDACRQIGAATVQTAVLLKKRLAARRGLPDVDFHGLVVDDRYVFGYGMDYRNYWRNANGIFAVPE